MMKFQATAIAGWILLSPLMAQEEAAVTLEPVDAAIEAFNNRDRSDPDPSTDIDTPPPAEKPDQPDQTPPKKPDNPGQIDLSDIPVDPDAAELLPPSQNEAKGLEVRVERLKQGSGNLKPESVRLLAPFPAKPLHEAPEGWLLKTSDSVPPIKRQVELVPGKAITLTIRPHLLVPEADQERILAVSEPGFEASLGYEQSDTVSAVLSDSIQKLDEDSRRIGNAIDQLQQLIVSLPKPKPENKPDSASSIPDAGTPIPEQP